MTDYLNDIYSQYGYHVQKNHYFICDDKDKIAAIFADMKNPYPEKIGEYKVKYVRDLTDGYDSEQPDNVPILPVSKSSHMITFTFENGATFTLRTSGTEPKIKYYTEYCGESYEEARATLDDMFKTGIIP